MFCLWHVCIDPVLILFKIVPYLSVRLVLLGPALWRRFPRASQSGFQTSRNSLRDHRVLYVRNQQFTSRCTVGVSLPHPLQQIASFKDDFCVLLHWPHTSATCWYQTDAREAPTTRWCTLVPLIQTGWAVEPFGVCERTLLFQACLRPADGHFFPQVFLCRQGALLHL